MFPTYLAKPASRAAPRRPCVWIARLLSCGDHMAVLLPGVKRCVCVIEYTQACAVGVHARPHACLQLCAPRGGREAGRCRSDCLARPGIALSRQAGAPRAGRTGPRGPRACFPSPWRLASGASLTPSAVALTWCCQLGGH